MRVVILNQFFYPDISATSQLMTDLAEDLTRQGATVTALCSNASYVGGKSFPGSEMLGAMRIERAPVIAFSRENIFRRIFSYLSFYITAFLRLLRLPKQDVILVLTTPPLIAIVAYAIKVLRGSRVAYLVQDLYPDIAFEFGLLKRGSLAGRILDRLAHFLLRKADGVIALGSCMRDRLVSKGIAEDKIVVITNWADGAKITPIAREGNPFRTAHGLENKFVVLYSGNMGRAHDFTAILGGMAALADENDIAFVFIGDGPKRVEVESFAKKHPAANVLLLDYVPRDELKFSMGAADLSVLAVADGLAGLVVPSKLYGIMASGRPALYVGPGSSEAARTVAAQNCGYAVGNDDAAGFAQAVLAARDDFRAAQQMGAVARRAFELEFDRPVATRRYFEFLEKLTKVT